MTEFVMSKSGDIEDLPFPPTLNDDDYYNLFLDEEELSSLNDSSDESFNNNDNLSLDQTLEEELSSLNDGSDKSFNNNNDLSFGHLTSHTNIYTLTVVPKPEANGNIPDQPDQGGSTQYKYVYHGKKSLYIISAQSENNPEEEPFNFINKDCILVAFANGAGEDYPKILYEGKGKYATELKDSKRKHIAVKVLKKGAYPYTINFREGNNKQRYWKIYAKEEEGWYQDITKTFCIIDNNNSNLFQSSFLGFKSENNTNTRVKKDNESLKVKAGRNMKKRSSSDNENDNHMRKKQRFGIEVRNSESDDTISLSSSDGSTDGGENLNMKIDGEENKKLAHDQVMLKISYPAEREEFEKLLKIPFNTIKMLKYK